MTLLVVLGLLAELPAEISNELRHHEAEDDQIVGLSVTVGDANLGRLV